MLRARLASVVLATAILVGSSALGAGPALLRVERRGGDDRAMLIQAGVTLVMERESSFLALGDAAALGQRLTQLGRDSLVVEADTEGWSYFSFWVLSPADLAELGTCGDVVLVEDNWALVRSAGQLPTACIESPRWSTRWLAMQPLQPPRTPPEPYASWQTSGQVPAAPNPVVRQIVDALTNTIISNNWDEILNAATTRYSRSTGCQTAAELVHGKFQALGLNPIYQYHTSGHAPNVIGTLTGYLHPEKVIIVIGHLDDVPSSGLAPGADDNASGATTVTSAAQALAGYTFTNTVRFIAVTGEEQGLYGSEYYASHIPTGDEIIAVLDADMVAWEGDTPANENLDVNTNSTSHWLGLLLQQCAVDYATGCVVDPFLCPGMGGSDHAPFWDRGYSAICAITDNGGSCGHGGFNPYYHTSSDTRTNCGSPTFFYGAVKTLVATAAHLAEPLCGGGTFPPVPTGVDAAGTGDNRITVSWTSGGAGIEYEVSRARGGCAGTFETVGTTTSTTYLDTNVSGGVTYAYRIRARRGDCLTEPSTCVEASTTGSCHEYPQFAGASTVANAAQPVCTLDIGWSSATPLCSGPVTYNVYRGSTASFVPGPGNRIATAVSGLTFTDIDNLTSFTPVYYAVRATDSSNGSEDLNTTVRTGTPTGPIAYSTWTDDAGDTGTATLTTGAPWGVNTTEGHNGPRVYKTTPANNACGALTTPALYIASGSQLTFWSKYFLGVDSADKGQVEVSSDDGVTWQRVTMVYPKAVTKTGDACALSAGLKYFADNNLTWMQHTAELSAWADLTVRLRFRLSTDAANNGEFWWIDDLRVTNVQTPEPCVPGTPGLAADSLTVDAASYAAGSSDANGVLEPGEQVTATPRWHNASAIPLTPTGTASDLLGPAGATYTLLDPSAAYESIAAGTDGTCTANPYGLGISDPATRPAAHWDLTFHETLSTGATTTWTVHVGDSFADVPRSHWGYRFVETVFHQGVTSGCNAVPFNYCPSVSLTRAEMAVLLLMAKHGSSYVPPASTGLVFADVPIDHWAGDFIEQLAAEGITSGCGGGNYCPNNPITRAEMAVMLLVAEHGVAWTPPLSTGTVFSDVPIDHWAGDFIEQLAAEGITGGCGPGIFCPDNPVTRAEMAVFLTSTFKLELNH